MGKTPRLDVYLRLIYRLYEALYFLHILGRVRGPRYIVRLDLSTLLDVRRRFLKNVAFLCDYQKGGPSSAAVAIEDHEDCNVFWIASNEGPKEDVRMFLESVITAAKTFQTMPEDKKTEAEVALTNKCINFAYSRIKKQAHGLSSSARQCREYIMEHMVDQRDLGEWLRQFEYSDYKDLPTICQQAYDVRKDSRVNRLLTLSGETGNDEAIVPVTIAPQFRKVRHIIGRLTAPIRTVKEVIEDSYRLKDLLDVFEVAVVPRPTSAPSLQADDHTNLSGILTRMLAAKDERLTVFLNYLSDLNQHKGIENELRNRFGPKKSAPCVHAEVQMLHHFYDNGRKFFAGDAYISLSKPACFACKLYFRHHPAGYVEPDSHEKVYPNWAPIGLPGTCWKDRNNSIWIKHRRVMNSVINDIGKEVISEIERRRRSPLYHEHPDTLTGLTASSHTLTDDSSDWGNNSGADGNESLKSDNDDDSEGGAVF